MISYESDLNLFRTNLNNLNDLIENDPSINSVCTLRRKAKLTESYLRSLLLILPDFNRYVRSKIRTNAEANNIAISLQDKQTIYLEKNLIKIKSGIVKGYSFNDFELLLDLNTVTMKKYLPKDLLNLISKNGVSKIKGCAFNRL